MERKLKIALIILIMALICVVSFGGIYVKKIVSYKNILPDYQLSAKLKGSRITTLKVDEDTKEVIYDAEGNTVSEIPEGEDEANYRKEQVPVNTEDIKTKENYKKTKQIMSDRLKSLGVANYEVRVDEDNGVISVELDETENTDTILSDLLVSGKFEIIDTDEGTVLMTNDDIASAGVVYNSTNSGISVYLDIKFNKEGKKKLTQISKDYATTEETTSDEESEETVTQKTITMNINGQEFLSTSFDNEVTNGELTISIGSASTDSSVIADNVKNAQFYATSISNGEILLTYDVASSDYIKSAYSNAIYQYILLGIVALIVLISIVYMIVKYKKLGIYASIVYIATIAILLIIVRYTKAVIGLETIISGIVLTIINTYINCRVLSKIDENDSLEDRKKNINSAYFKLGDIFVIALIPAVVFTYNSFSAIYSVGMILFWGVISIALMNILFTRTLLINSTKK